MTPERFSEIVGQTKTVVLSAVSRYLSPHLKHYIDDVVQETYYKAYRRLAKAKTEEDIRNLNNFLFTIAKNEAFRLNDREKKQIALSEALTIESPTESLPESTEQKDMVNLINELPQPFLDVTKLFQKGYSLKEISEKLNIKVGTVKSRLHRSKKLLQTSYQKKEENNEL